MERVNSFEELEKTRLSVLRSKASGKITVSVCAGTGCVACGCEAVLDAFKKAIQKLGLSRKVELKPTGCPGFCERGTIVVILPQGIFYQKVNPSDAVEILRKTVARNEIIDRLLYVDPVSGQKIFYEKDLPFYKNQTRVLLSQNSQVDPTRIEDYLAIGGYSALAKVLERLSPVEVIDTIKRSGLRGRGGAGFPTGYKWDFCRRANGEPKFVICNADEGDPGAFMDRSLLEGNPHSIIEGMLIGAFAIGASHGYIYVRHEYPLAFKNARLAKEVATKTGLLGENILGTAFSFDLKINRGAGAFVCGEETALMASVQGRRGVPRQRPPFPITKGLFGKPTNINNVETWANVPQIIVNGPEWFAKIGTESSKGTKIFSLVGKIQNTGLVEVPMGMSLGDIVYNIGGGVPQDRHLKAIQTGGPSGGCIPRSMLNLPVDYEKLAEAGSIMGSGGMIVMDERTCMVDIARYFLNFLKDESCGKCLPCREGIRRMLEIVTDISEGNGNEGDIELLEELAYVIKDTTLCGLGQTAANPILSTLKYFKYEYEAHLRQKRCEAAVCKKITSAPCHHTCPIGTDAALYIAKIAAGKFDEALDVVLAENPLPTICSRICHHPCESRCRSGEVGEAISIRALKRAAIEFGQLNGKRPRVKTTHTEKVALIGAGPAGLSAAYYLRLKGYPVTVFDRLPVAGGMLAAGIPRFRLPREDMERDIERIRKSGVEMRLSTEFGKDVFLDSLKAEGYRAFFLATGAHASKKLGIPGEQAAGVIPSMKFLTEMNLGRSITVGPKVVVIGGGNSAVDAARVARRLPGVESVQILYRRTKAEMPAFKEEVEAAVEEGIDIKTLTAPKEIIVQEGKAKAVECVRMLPGRFDESGRRRPEPIGGSEWTVEADTIISAIGEQPDVSFLGGDSGVAVTKRNTVEVNPETYETGAPGVFAGGDVVSGPNTVVEAIAAGKTAAESIDRFLSGASQTRTYEKTRPTGFEKPVLLSEAEIAKARRPDQPHVEPEKRVAGFDETVSGLSRKAAVAEARRCLRCDL